MTHWSKKRSPRWLTHLVGGPVGACVCAALLGPCMGAACGVLFLVYWLLGYATTPLPSALRRGLILGYATLHLGSWVMMHVLLGMTLHDRVRLMHDRAASSIPLEIARMRSWEPDLDPEFEEHMRNRINPRPWSRVITVCPLPFVIVANEDYQIGPLWGLGVQRVYVFGLSGLKLQLEARRWVS